MTLPPPKYEKAKPRAKTKPGRSVALSPAERAKYELAANEATERAKHYGIHVPVDRRKI
jgi:hypothetical protein